MPVINPGYSGILLLGQSAIPTILVPNGTVAADGTITLVTALPAIYANAWIYLPAGAISSGGGLAGLYFVQFSSTTVGSVKTNYSSVAADFIPTIPAGPLVAATGSGVAYTQITGSYVSLASFKVPGGLLRKYGSLRATIMYSINNTPTVRTVSFGVAGILGVAGTISGTVQSRNQFVFNNRGGVSVNTNGSFSTPFGTTANSPTIGLINFDIDNIFYCQAQLAVSTDCLIYEAATVEIIPSD